MSRNKNEHYDYLIEYACFYWQTGTIKLGLYCKQHIGCFRNARTYFSRSARLTWLLNGNVVKRHLLQIKHMHIPVLHGCKCVSTNSQLWSPRNNENRLKYWRNSSDRLNEALIIASNNDTEIMEMGQNVDVNKMIIWLSHVCHILAYVAPSHPSSKIRPHINLPSIKADPYPNLETYLNVVVRTVYTQNIWQ